MAAYLLHVCLLAVLAPRAASPWGPYQYEGEFPLQDNAPHDRIPESRIHFGEKVNIEDYPYTVYIYLGYYSWPYHRTCAGVILNSDWVLSAAHCFKWRDRDPRQVEIRAGSAHRLFGGSEHTAVKSVTYKNYQFGKYRHDIALVQVQPDFQFDGANIRPANLFPKYIERINDGQSASIVGWGDKEDGDISDVLLKADTKIIELEHCRMSKRYENLSQWNICAEPTSYKSGMCWGDSGGPLIVEGYLFGIASFIPARCGTGYPSVYTRVNYYRDFIYTITGTYNEGPFRTKFLGETSGIQRRTKRR